MVEMEEVRDGVVEMLAVRDGVVEMEGEFDALGTPLLDVRVLVAVLLLVLEEVEVLLLDLVTEMVLEAEGAAFSLSKVVVPPPSSVERVLPCCSLRSARREAWAATHRTRTTAAEARRLRMAGTGGGERWWYEVCGWHRSWQAATTTPSTRRLGLAKPLANRAPQWGW